MSSKNNAKLEYGDFQTPDILCDKICSLLSNLNVSPNSVVEPTCGTGSFLRASARAFPGCRQILGFDINPSYILSSQTIERALVQCEDFFEKDWPSTLNSLKEPILVLGNPPWVTNAAVGVINGSNLPRKSNFHRLNGFDAITGKSNFDISEWMLLHLLEWLSGSYAVLAMLCKTAVARKVLQYAWSRWLQVKTCATYSVNAKEHFGVSVEACLLVCILEPGTSSRECEVYRDLDDSTAHSKFAFRNGRLVANLNAFERYWYLYGHSPLKWRSGIKHDCSRIMELHICGEQSYKNGFGDVVELEPTYLYPMFKSSELVKIKSEPLRRMLVTQQIVGEDTLSIQSKAPRTWSYLEKYAEYLDGRYSSIYRNRPRFSMFGVGPYAFSSWKVAISGFYKNLQFRAIGPSDRKPVVFDDTCYFLPCESKDQARDILKLLNSQAARGFFDSVIFWDAKRPITADVLGNLNLGVLSMELGVSLPGQVGRTMELPLWQGREPPMTGEGL